jgi:uncharacterized cupredoxin-like copper-binding protein
LVAACGGDDDTGGTLSTGGDGERTIQVDMVDTAFEPDTLEVDEGDTVRFEFTNTGENPHDAFIGNAAAQQDHEREMRETVDADHGMDGMGTEDEDDGITLEPGESGDLTYTFEQARTIEVGCHQPDHYEAGMKVHITVG